MRKKSTNYAAKMKERMANLAAYESLFDQDISDDEIHFTSMVESTDDMFDDQYEDCAENIPNFFVKHKDRFELDSKSIRK